jgi:hypothetical protein
MQPKNPSVKGCEDLLRQGIRHRGSEQVQRRFVRINLDLAPWLFYRLESIHDSHFPQEKDGGAEGIRTPDPHNAIVVLYQLSYDPIQSGKCRALNRIVKTILTPKQWIGIPKWPVSFPEFVGAGETRGSIASELPPGNHQERFLIGRDSAKKIA